MRRSTSRELLVQLGAQRVVLGGQLGQPGEVLDLGLERAERLQPARRAPVLGRDRRRLLLVVPEARLLHLGLEAARPGALAQAGQR